MTFLDNELPCNFIVATKSKEVRSFPYIYPFTIHLDKCVYYRARVRESVGK